MYGLLVEPSRLERIIGSSELWERKAFRTRKRGRIALVDRETRRIRGFAELYDVKPITYKQFVEQYEGKWMTGDLWASHRQYYEMCFRNLEKTEPIDVSGFGDDGVWCELPNDIGVKRQRTLFEF